MSMKSAARHGFDQMPAGEGWRPGSAGREPAGAGPWSGGVLARIPLESEPGVAAARTAAGTAQPGWPADAFTTRHRVPVQRARRPYLTETSDGTRAGDD